MRQGRSSRSAKSKWWPIRAPMWTRRFTGTPMGRTSPNCRWSRSWTWMASWCGMPGGRSAAPHSDRNTGPYVDSPFHRYADGKDLSELPLESLVDLDGIVVRHAGRAIGRSAFGDLDLRGKAVLVHTGWDRHWATEQYFEGHPFLTAEAAQHIADSGAALAGIDSLNIDDTADLSRQAH